MEPGDLKQLVPGELTEEGHAASGFQLGLWSVLEPFLPVVVRVSCWSTQPVRASLPPTRSTFKRQHLVRQSKAHTLLPASWPAAAPLTACQTELLGPGLV